MRAGPLSDDKVIDLLNRYFVPVYVTNEDYTHGDASTPEKAARTQMIREAWASDKASLLRASDAACYVLAPGGKVIDALRLPECLVTEKVTALLENAIKKLAIPEGKPLVKATPQSAPPTAKPSDLVLHLTARYLPAGGTWKQLPAEDWIVLERAEAVKFLAPADAKVGDSWTVDRAVVTKVLSNFYPPSANRNPATNEVDKPAMKATVVSVKDGVVRVRLDSNLKMKH